MNDGDERVMAQKLQVPKFASEADEARWLFEHREDVADEFELAEREGRLGRGTVSRLANAIALDPEDVARARALAERRGLDLSGVRQDGGASGALERREDRVASLR